MNKLTAAAFLMLVLTALPAQAQHCRPQSVADLDVWKDKLRDAVVLILVDRPGEEQARALGVLVRDGSRQLLLTPLHSFLAKRNGRYVSPLKPDEATITIWHSPKTRQAYRSRKHKSFLVFPRATAGTVPNATPIAPTVYVQADTDYVLFEIPGAALYKDGSSTAGLPLAAHGTTGDKVCIARFFHHDTPDDIDISDVQEAKRTRPPETLAVSGIPNFEHLSGATILTETGEVLGLLQYAAAKPALPFVNGIQCSLQSLAVASTGTPLVQSSGKVFLSMQRRFGAALDRVAKCDAEKRLGRDLDNILQANLDYRERDVVLAFPKQYAAFIGSVETKAALVAKEVDANAACACKSTAELTETVVTLARLQRRLDGLSEFGDLVLSILSKPPVANSGRIPQPDDVNSIKVADICTGSFRWAVVGPKLLSPVDRVFGCAVAKQEGATDFSVLLTTRVFDSDICGPVELWNQVAGTSKSCTAAKDRWRQALNGVPTNVTWGELGTVEGADAQVRLWKSAVRSGLFEEADRFVARVHSLDPEALRQDAALAIDFAAELNRISKLSLSGATEQRVKELSDLLANPATSISPLVTGKAATPTALFHDIVLALPAPAQGRGVRSISREFDRSIGRVRKALDAATDAAVADLATRCGTAAASGPPASIP